ICKDCLSPLKAGRIPKFSLKNGLYRGVLPEDLRDLTWIEEMVCAKYRTTAHVTRLYQSSSDGDPLVLRGNTCAHDMNIVSTASVLPRTPANILGQISVVFVGPGPVTNQYLNLLQFTVRKDKVWRFLCWLKKNNPLYAGLTISLEHLNMYGDDGTIPGLLESVILDNK
ncbi:hypothetical protein BOTBODRAFT_91622, partial [Botryobasidium botryosum FD-172 SS1]